MAIDEAWANSAWPWISALAQSSGVAIPDGMPGIIAEETLLALAGAAERVDATSNTYVLSYLIGIMYEGKTLRENQGSLIHAARQVNSSVALASADQLAADITVAAHEINALPELRLALAQALGRAAQTSAVLDALRLLDDGASVSPPPPPPRRAPIAPDPQGRSAPAIDERGAATGTSHTPDEPAAPESSGSRATSEDPWMAFCGAHGTGDVVRGRVTGTQDYGAFVSIEEGVSGLVHSSEIPNRQGRRMSDLFRVGQQVVVRIAKIDEERRRIDLSMREVPHELSARADSAGQADDGPAETQSIGDPAAMTFLEAAREILIERNGVSRPLLREMARIRGGRMYSALEDPLNPRKARDVASALIAALAGWALTRPLTNSQLDIMTLAGNCLGDRQNAALINGLTWASNDALVPTPIQVSEALDGAGPSRSEVRDLVVCCLIRALNRAIGDEDVTKASHVIDAAVELGADLPQSKAGELVDLLSSMNLPTTVSLKFGELRDRADPANRPDLAAITEPEDRGTLLGALGMLQAQIAVEVARKNREELLAQALMWLAQQLGDTLKHWMPPRTQHPAVLIYERKHPQNARRRGFVDKPTGLRREVVQRAIAGEAAAARQAAQALESFLRTGDAAAEEWDAFLAATLGTSLNEAASTWRKIKNPSPEVSWNLAMFEATQPFTRHMAWRPLEHALSTYQSNPLTALHALYHAIKTLSDPSASHEAHQASREFVIQWGPDVPDGRLLLASLSLMDVETEQGYNRALETFSQWQLLGDPPTLLPSIGRRSTAETRRQIQELRRDNRYSRRWILLILCEAAYAPTQQAVSVSCLNAASEVAEQLGEVTIARSAHERGVEIALDQHSHPRAGTEQAVRKTFESTCIAALTFSRNTGDQRLARQVRSAMQEAGGTWSNKTDELLTELLGAPENGRTRPPAITDRSGQVQPALAELAQPFNAARTPADIVALKPRMMSALTIVVALEETVRLVSEVMAGFDRLAGGVGMHEARDLLQEIADRAGELDAQHGRSGDNSLTAMLKAVERARVYAAEQIEDAPAPTVEVAPGWCGVAIEAERPQLVLKVTAPAHDDITKVAITAGADPVQLGTLAAGEERTVAVYADLTRDTDRAGASLTVTWTWGMVADRSRTTSLVVPLVSWGGMLGDAGLTGLAIPNRFIVGEPLVGEQLSSGLFQGRQDHLEHIESAYGSVLPAQPTCFHGIRKVGKSSLLNRVVRQLQDSGHIVIAITAQGLQPSVQDQEAIVANICRRMAKANPPLFTGMEIPSRVENGVAYLEDFFEAFAKSAAAVSGMSPILVIDEFHCLYRAEVAGLLAVFRMLAETRRVGFVFAATEGPSGLPTEASLFLTPRRVDFLIESEVSSLVEAVFADTPMEVPADVRTYLFDASAGNPNFTAAIARRALDAANDGRRNILCANDIDLASAEISSTRPEMFEQSWFAPDILSDRDRAAAVDLAFTAKQPRGWMDLRDVTTRLGEGGRGILFRLTSAYVLESSETGGVRQVRIRGGVLESYLQQQHGVTLTPSPDTTRASVGIFLDVENLIRGATSPEELVEQIERFGNRFGAVQVRVTSATPAALVRAGWQPHRVEAAFDAAAWQFRPPPPALAGKESIADNVLAPIITQSAEQYNLAEIIVGSGDHSFIPVAQALIGDGGQNMSASGRRVHALSMKLDGVSGRSPRHPEWETLARRRFDVCLVLAEERPDLVLWDLESVLADPEGAPPASPMTYTPH
jgi:predicted RNA-binding protein with RPS1 domain